MNITSSRLTVLFLFLIFFYLISLIFLSGYFFLIKNFRETIYMKHLHYRTPFIPYAQLILCFVSIVFILSFNYVILYIFALHLVFFLLCLFFLYKIFENFFNRKTTKNGEKRLHFNYLVPNEINNCIADSSEANVFIVNQN